MNQTDSAIVPKTPAPIVIPPKTTYDCIICLESFPHEWDIGNFRCCSAKWCNTCNSQIDKCPQCRKPAPHKINSSTTPVVTTTTTDPPVVTTTTAAPPVDRLTQLLTQQRLNLERVLRCKQQLPTAIPYQALLLRTGLEEYQRIYNISQALIAQQIALSPPGIEYTQPYRSTLGRIEQLKASIRLLDQQALRAARAAAWQTVPNNEDIDPDGYDTDDDDDIVPPSVNNGPSVVDDLLDRHLTLSQFSTADADLLKSASHAADYKLVKSGLKRAYLTRAGWKYIDNSKLTTCGKKSLISNQIPLA
jgi:hypothetical protein